MFLFRVTFGCFDNSLDFFITERLGTIYIVDKSLN
jgi:hypothetical protein